MTWPENIQASREHMARHTLRISAQTDHRLSLGEKVYTFCGYAVAVFCTAFVHFFLYTFVKKRRFPRVRLTDTGSVGDITILHFVQEL